GPSIAPAAAKAETCRAEFPVAVGTRFEPPRGGDEILEPLGGIEFREELTALVVVARITAHRRNRVRSKCIEVLQGKAPRHVLRVRIEAPILMDDDNARQFRRGLAA